MKPYEISRSINFVDGQFQGLADSINPIYLNTAQLQRLNEMFRHAEPFPHLVLSNFFNEDYLLDIVELLGEEPFFQKDSDLFQFLQTEDLENLSHKILRDFKQFLSSQMFVELMQSLTGLELQTGKVDATGNLYSDTDYLLCHDDQLPGRKLAFIIYLSDLEEGQGGTLNLFDQKEGKPHQVVKKILPKFNTFTFFEVLPHSFHEVEEVIGENYRASITGWFYGKD